MTGHFMFRNHLCIAFECLSINLYEFIKINGFQGFSMGLIRRFAMQLLNSLVLLQDHKLIHCDLKPEVNIYIVFLDFFLMLLNPFFVRK